MGNMGPFEQLMNGFLNLISITNLLACFAGSFLGTIVGVLPGVGPAATMTFMLPFTLGVSPETGLIMLTGIWFGSQYGGSTTSILVNIPGEAASVVTCIDGYQMTKKGRGGAALTLSATGSFIAGTIGIIGLQFFAPSLAKAALMFGPPEYLAFMLLAFILLLSLAGESPAKGLVMFGLGFWVSAIGLSDLDGIPRFNFGSDNLIMGIEFVPVAVGIFGVTEILSIAIEKYVPPIMTKVRIRDLYPNRDEIKRSVGPTFRGSILGFFMGLLPGPCTIISTFIAYTIEKKLSKTPQEFGKGMVEGVVGPESANNSAVMGSMVPLLTLGIPFAAPSVIMLAGLRMHNVYPGPLLFIDTPHIFWTFIAAMYLGNLILLVLNLPLVGLFARIAMIRPSLLMPFVSIICLIGVYSMRNSFFDVWIMIFSGFIGLLFRKWGFPIAPLVIGMVLGPMTEINLRKTLIMFDGSLFPMFSSPIAGTFLGCSLAIIVFMTWRHFWRRHQTPNRDKPLP
jgi:putative tricarboxylic transport membrane protein